MEIWAKCVKTFAKLLWFEFTEMAPKIKVQSFLLGHVFWESLGEIWAKMVLEVP